MNLGKLVSHIAPVRSSTALTERFWRQVEENERFLYGAALRYTGQSFDAEDLVQQTLEKAFKNYAQLKDPDRFRGWIFTILRHTHLKNRQRAPAQGRQTPFDEQADYIELLTQAASADPSRLYAQKMVKRTIRQALQTLPEPFQAVLILHYMEDFHYREISATLDIPIGTVMSRLARGKQHLKKALLRNEVNVTSRNILGNVSQKRS